MLVPVDFDEHFFFNLSQDQPSFPQAGHCFLCSVQYNNFVYIYLLYVKHSQLNVNVGEQGIMPYQIDECSLMNVCKQSNHP